MRNSSAIALVRRSLPTAALILFVLLILPLAYVLCTGDYPGASLFYGVQEDEPLTDGVITLHHAILRGM